VRLITPNVVEAEKLCTQRPRHGDGRTYVLRRIKSTSLSLAGRSARYAPERAIPADRTAGGSTVCRAAVEHRSPVRNASGPPRQKISLHDQFADLGVQTLDLRSWWRRRGCHSRRPATSAPEAPSSRHISGWGELDSCPLRASMAIFAFSAPSIFRLVLCFIVRFVENRLFRHIAENWRGRPLTGSHRRRRANWRDYHESRFEGRLCARHPHLSQGHQGQECRDGNSRHHRRCVPS
jgi:hypothetical protein